MNSYYKIDANGNICSLNEKSPWLQVEFTKGFVSLIGFRLRKGRSFQLPELKIIGTNNANDPIEKWLTLKIISESLQKDFPLFNIYLFEKVSNPTKIIRIISTKPNRSGDNQIAFYHVDFFGSYFEK